MKKILYIALLIAGMLSAIGCEEQQEIEILPEKITGQWELKTIDGEPADNRVVYVDIQEKGDFILYQKIWSNQFQKYTGSVKIFGENGGLKFTYSNGDTSGYKSMSVERKVLATEENPDIPDLIILTLERESGEINVYHKTTIPQGIIDIAVPATKSADALPFL